MHKLVQSAKLPCLSLSRCTLDRSVGDIPRPCLASSSTSKPKLVLRDASWSSSSSKLCLPASARTGLSPLTRTFAVQPGVASPASLTADGSDPTWQIRVLFDGECPLCVKEVDFLKERDAGSGRIDFVDIAEPCYSPERNAGLSFEQAMGEIHAILPDGSIVTKVEVFRRLYEMVGLGWVYAVTKVPGVGPAADAVYDLWAKYRLPITGRPDLLDVVKRRAENASCREERVAQTAAAARSGSVSGATSASTVEK